MEEEASIEECTVFKWKNIDTNNGPRGMRHGMCAAVVGHKVYVFGGIESGKSLDTWHVSVIDATREFRWTHLQVEGTQPTGRRNLSCWLHKNLVYIYGGDIYSGQGAVFDELWRYDIELNEFEKVEAKGEQLGRRNFISAGYIERREECVIYGGGGTEGTIENPRCIDMRTLQCTIPRLSGNGPGPQARNGSCVVGQTLYMMGGTSQAERARSLYMLHCEIPGKFRWSQPKLRFPFISQNYRYNTTLVACGSRLFYLGGAPLQTDATLYYSTKTNTWGVSGKESNPAPATNSHLSVYVNRKIYCYGGFPRHRLKPVWVLSVS